MSQPSISVSTTPSQAPVRILCIGDSITKGGSFVGGYRGPLQAHLRDAGWEFLFVGGSQLNSEGMQQPFHEGHSGFRIQMIRDGAITENSENSPLPETLERHRPDLVLLLIGTNDMYLGDPVECAALTEELMDLILQSATKPTLLVGGIMPILPGLKPWGTLVPDDITDRVNAYNKLQCEAAIRRAGEGFACAYVDHSPAGQAADTHVEDGVHLTEAGNRRLAASWFAKLSENDWCEARISGADFRQR
ncbi:MAG: SGNH/GDSL hydrolase family protein [Verrucomicrobiota bacterium]